MLYHFHTANGDVAYCYNWDFHAPDAPDGINYDQYKFFDGMNAATGNDEQKVKEVAAALEVGYHKDADAGKYEIAPQFQSDAQSSYQKVKQELQSNNITHQYGDLYGAPSNDISDPGYLATHTQLVQDILNYAQNHPLDKKTAYPQNVPVTDKAGKTVNGSNPLVMDSTTKENNKFTLSNSQTFQRDMRLY